VTLADVKQWHESSFSTKTSVISVAGSSTADAVAKEIDLLFAELPDTPLSEPIEFKQPEVPGKTILLHSPEAPKSVLILMV